MTLDNKMKAIKGCKYRIFYRKYITGTNRMNALIDLLINIFNNSKKKANNNNSSSSSIPLNAAEHINNSSGINLNSNGNNKLNMSTE